VSLATRQTAFAGGYYETAERHYRARKINAPQIPTINCKFTFKGLFRNTADIALFV